MAVHLPDTLYRSLQDASSHNIELQIDLAAGGCYSPNNRTVRPKSNGNDLTGFGGCVCNAPACRAQRCGLDR